MDAMTLKTLPDEQARIAALRAGAIDGATVSTDGAAALKNDSNLVVLKGGTAAFRELQMTIKPARPKPWHDVRVRQAVNFAINRQAIIDTVYSGNGNYSGIVPPGYGPWPLTQAELKTKYQKFDLREGEGADGRGRAVEGLLGQAVDVLDAARLPAGRLGDQVAAEGDQHRRRTSWPRSRARSRANNGIGNFEWDLTARGMRGDVDGYLNEYNPTAAVYKVVVPALEEREGLARCRQRQDHARSGQAAADLQGRPGAAPERACRRSGSCR